jgi:alpha-L-arabinofuranosidase
MKAGAASIGVPFRYTEANSFWDGGAIGVSNSYASSLWVIDFLFNIAQGGGTGVNLTGGGNTGGYTPIADIDGAVVEARPEYYGTLLFTLAGQGTLFETAVSASGLDVSAYAVECPDGGLNVIVVNKDATHNLQLAIECGRAVRSAELMVMTGPSLAATNGVAIQGAMVAQDGSFAPGAPYSATASDDTVSCYLGALSAALIQIV